jgi:hypothetical protein
LAQGKHDARRGKAWIVFEGESGISLTPLGRGGGGGVFGGGSGGELPEGPGDRTPLTDADPAALPEPAQRYAHFMGIGEPRT